MIRKLFALAALAAAFSAAAEESPRWGAFELSVGGYKPSIDKGVAGAPYATVFGGSGIMFRADVAKSLYTEFGELDVGIGGGFSQKTGHGFASTQVAGGTQPDFTTRATDETTFRVIPARVSVTYRFDVLWERYGIPLAPYGRLSLERYFWWSLNATGTSASGATNGYSLSGGLAFLLDFLDPTRGRDMDRDIGINHTYVFVDFTKSSIKNFGSATSWDLSQDGVQVSGGLLFVF